MKWNATKTFITLIVVVCIAIVALFMWAAEGLPDVEEVNSNLDTLPLSLDNFELDKIVTQYNSENYGFSFESPVELSIDVTEKNDKRVSRTLLFKNSKEEKATLYISLDSVNGSCRMYKEYKEYVKKIGEYEWYIEQDSTMTSNYTLYNRKQGAYCLEFRFGYQSFIEGLGDHNSVPGKTFDELEKIYGPIRIAIMESFEIK